MREIRLARMGKTRPVVVLTREAVREYRPWVTIAPITSTVRDLGFEVAVGAANGLELSGVINCDAIQTVLVTDLGRRVGYLGDEQELALTAAIHYALDLHT